MSDRVAKVRSRLKDNGLDGILVTTPENRRYLSGFTGSAGQLFVSGDRAILATDFRYTEQATVQASDFEVVRSGADWSWLVAHLKDSKLRRLGFESQQMSVYTHHQMKDALKQGCGDTLPSLVGTNGLVEGPRCFKDEAELALLQRAIDVADEAMENVCATIKAGDTEREIAWRMERAMREMGADGPSFETIVAAGPNGAMPHHRPSDRPIAEGEPVVIDMGAIVEGYCSDITRTICLGEQDDTFRKIYDIVLGSQLTAIANVKPGMSGGDADGLARAVIEEAGYGDSFGHSLGHGYGLAVHENPRVGPNATDRLECGMVFTVEPGIYVTGWGGVRIEDDVVLEADGARVLSKAKK